MNDIGFTFVFVVFCWMIPVTSPHMWKVRSNQDHIPGFKMFDVIPDKLSTRSFYKTN